MTGGAKRRRESVGEACGCVVWVDERGEAVDEGGPRNHRNPKGEERSVGLPSRQPRGFPAVFIPATDYSEILQTTLAATRPALFSPRQPHASPTDCGTRTVGASFQLAPALRSSSLTRVSRPCHRTVMWCALSSLIQSSQTLTSIHHCLRRQRLISTFAFVDKGHVL